mmetsp:Transcript_56197/g.103047  ORF Transcript_56197/g.103047 Transcript_56197/m.103047 type:complete len:813 (-) Transcript_56197:54-2492(-)
MPPAEGSVPLLGAASRVSEKDIDKEKDCGHGFSFVIVFPLPEMATAEEEKQFRKRMAPGKTCKDVLLDLMNRDGLSADEEETMRIDCDDTLEGLRTATIEIFYSLFKSLIVSHTKGDPDDDSDIFCFTSVDQDELFMCVKMSDGVVEVLADMCEYPVQLCQDSLQGLNILITGAPALKNLVLAHVKYDKFEKEKDYLCQYDLGLHSRKTTLLPQKDRVRLIYDRIITYVDLLEMKRLGLVLHTYPSHGVRINRELKEEWANLSLVYTCSQPLDKVREYFGEELGFYFLFVQRVGVAEKFLIAAALFYTFLSSVWPEDDVSKKYKDLPKVLYSIALMLWFFILVKHWRRTETYFANKWGMDRAMQALTLKQPINPSFEGIYVGSAVDENRTVLAPIKWKRRWGSVAAVVIEGFFQALVIVVLLGLQARYTNYSNCENHPGSCEQEPKPLFGMIAMSTAVSITLSITIKVFNFVWTVVAEKLCDAEQHVFLVDWNAARTAKIFRFQFISTFFAFFALVMLPVIAASPILAKLWGWDDKEESDEQVMENAQVNLAASLKINFYLYVAFGILDMAIPWGTLKCNIHSERRAMEKAGKESFKLSQLEEQAKMLEYTGADAADDYMAIIFPLGFVILFSQAMPLFSSCLSFVAVSTQIRADAWKFIVAYRRPFPEMVNGIGNWNGFLEAFVWFGIGLNALQFTTVMQIEDIMKSIVPSFADHYKKDPGLMEYVEFSSYVVVCYCLRLLVDRSIGDMDSRTALERQRQDLQRTRLFSQEEGFDEKVMLSCTGCNDIKQWGQTPRLGPGNPMYVHAGRQV